ncbi:MAG: DUF2279 domain-containing protein [Lewinella sp.]|nr:DUF2279 domain-containing protein [Lewinella sp.]
MRPFYRVLPFRLLLLLSGLLLSGLLPGQTNVDGWRWLAPADSLHHARFWGCAGGGALVYGAASVGLYQTWYKDHDLGPFHTFNDMREWQQMDKLGHWLTAYTETRLVYGGARWTGLNKRQSLWTAAAVGTLLQATVEVMDGFSEKWGFSVGDITFNTLGVGAFVSQQALWNEQRIIFKLSGNMALPEERTINALDGTSTASLLARHHELFGTSLAERWLKDYNTMTIWASVNVRAFAPESRWPRWLNLAVGLGAANMYGGFENSWMDEAGNEFRLPDADFPRYRQFYLSPDIDLTRIPTHKRWLRTLFSVLNFIKIPAPALEINGQGRVVFHPVYF